MAVKGDIAGCLSMSPSPELTGLIDFSARPLFTCYAGYFYKIGKPPQVTRQEDLPAKTVVGTVIGYEYPAAFEVLRQKGVVVLEESPSEQINLRKLALGRVDLALLNYNEMKSPDWLIARAGVNGKVKTSFQAGILNSYIGFSRKHPQGAWALLQFNQGYRLITANGTLQRVRKTWFKTLASEKTTSYR
jgi:ABC-type amino acid transport substrate-binding protein